MMMKMLIAMNVALVTAELINENDVVNFFDFKDMLL